MKIPLGKKLKFSLNRIYQRAETKLHDLTYLFWELTLRCNLNCLHCGSDCQKTSEVKDMPLKDFLKVLDQVMLNFNPHKTLIVLTGGEPLMRDDLEECGMAFFKREFPWGMVTNGFSMTEKRFAGLIKSGLRSLTVSLDGLKDSHNWLRNHPKSYDNAMNTIKLAVNTKHLIFDVVTCVNRKNIGELNKIKETLINAGLKRWRMFTIFPKGRSHNNPDMDLTPEEFKILMDFIVETRKEGRISAEFSCEGYVGNYEFAVRDGMFFCRAGVNVGSVLADGGISACPSLRGDYIQGNIYKDDFMDVWNNRFQVMRDRRWLKQGECKNCKEFKWCNGNGLHLRDEKSGELLRCHYNLLKEAQK